jgi:hypothetical protein
MFRIPGKSAKSAPKGTLVPSNQLTGLETVEEIYALLMRSRKRT